MAAAATGGRLRRRHRLPVLVHVLRRDPRPRWADTHDARSRHRARDARPPGPAHSQHPRPRATLRSGRVAVDHLVRNEPQDGAPAPVVRVRCGAPATPGRALVPRRQPLGDGHRPGGPDGGARRTLAAHVVRLQLRLLSRARRNAAGRGAVRPTAGRDQELARVRDGGDRDRAVRRGDRGLRGRRRRARSQPVVARPSICC